MFIHLPIEGHLGSGYFNVQSELKITAVDHRRNSMVFEGRRTNGENIYFRYGGKSDTQCQCIFKHTFKKHNQEKVLIEELMFFTKCFSFGAGKATYSYCFLVQHLSYCCLLTKSRSLHCYQFQPPYAVLLSPHLAFKFNSILSNLFLFGALCFHTIMSASILVLCFRSLNKGRDF